MGINRNSLPAIGIVIIFALQPPASLAQNDFFQTLNVDIPTQEAEQNYSLFGWVTQKVGYGMESPDAPFSRTDQAINNLETSLFAQFDTVVGEHSNLRFSIKAFHDEVFHIKDDFNYSRAERDAFRNRIEIRDFYIEHDFNNGWFAKLGNQIIAWGQSEYMRVTDLVNPEDQYTFGQQDLEDLRLQVPAALLTYSNDNWTYDLAVTTDAGRNRLAPARDEFDQFIGLRQGPFLLNKQSVERKTETFLRVSTHYSRGDIQIVLADYNHNQLTGQAILNPMSATPQLIYGQSRGKALGVSINWVAGSWLVFGEAGIHRDVPMQPDSEHFFTMFNGWKEKDQMLGVIGIEYSGLRNALLSLELDSVTTRNYESGLQADEHQLGVGARLYWTALNERLQLLAALNELADDAGRVGRISLDYNISDNWQVGALWVGYHASTSSPLHQFRHNDVVQLQLRYSFQM